MTDNNHNKCEEYFDCCLYFTANTMSRLINKMADEAFMQTGLAPSYAFVMMAIIDHQNMSQSELADFVNLSPSTVTRFVDKLILKELVERKHEGKITKVSATKQGQALHPLITECWKKLYDNYCEVLGEDFAVKLTADMAKTNKILKG
jgi:DNA-binding MarR family transcriptional regulator